MTVVPPRFSFRHGNSLEFVLDSSKDGVNSTAPRGTSSILCPRRTKHAVASLRRLSRER